MQSLGESHQTIQEDMEREIDSSMASIGGALAEIAKKIVAEYNKMQNIMDRTLRWIILQTLAKTAENIGLPYRI